MTDSEGEIWDFVHRHLRSIFTRDLVTYKATTSSELSLYEWFRAPVPDASAAVAAVLAGGPLGPGDAVLVKGSRVAGLEAVAVQLLAS